MSWSRRDPRMPALIEASSGIGEPSRFLGLDAMRAAPQHLQHADAEGATAARSSRAPHGAAVEVAPGVRRRPIVDDPSEPATWRPAGQPALRRDGEPDAEAETDQPPLHDQVGTS